jgi:hypothetical protein
MIVLGNKFDKTNYELEDCKDGSKKKMTLEELIKFFKDINIF